MMSLIDKYTFLIHDYETFGKHPTFDRPAQFASIRTDSNFKIIEDPNIFFCRPTNDYLPDPEAVLITGITPQQALRNGVNEAEFARHINKLFCVPDTCILGYNNINFDDEISRNLFYRNFYDPYSWSWQQGNSRWDLLNVVRACYALRPNGIEWPFNNEGKPSFRLEHLTSANNIEHINAHNAMDDVYATLALAKLIRQAQPKLFYYLYHHRRKQQLKKLVNVTTMKPLVYVSSCLGASRGNTTWIAPIAWNPYNSNELLVCDLSGDIRILDNLKTHTLDADFYSKNSTVKNNTTTVPLKLVHLNKCPVLVPANTLRSIDADRLGIHRQQCLDNLTWLRLQPKIRKKALALFSEHENFMSSDDVDTQLYNGFFNDTDRASMDIILATAPQNLPALNIDFIDPRIKSLLFRYRARNFSYTLDYDEQIFWLEHRKKIFTQPRLITYIHKLEMLYLENKDDMQKARLLRALFIYLHKNSYY
ncbi:Exodeoxyribonuclease I [Candidatus Mikella endobia]|uniref:Exodeoxyribonuclease I n=1 Tax=Candidatus Mikella endobia TaxID=1778264 RepID=A0A143WR56_9ENTR|nr:exodeoxyribonuclease I [Candidatus Mikella endobia]CUX96027.1 Exodeoxyribonuclease I [Candidatus Mikella endobia]